MSSRPFAPQDFGVIRVRNDRFSKHRQPWSPFLGFLVAHLFACGPVDWRLMWWLVNRQPDASAASPRRMTDAISQ